MTRHRLDNDAWAFGSRAEFVSPSAEHATAPLGAERTGDDAGFVKG